MTSDTKLAEMLCTRLCHDLTGPIGAVNNGAEFLEEDGFDMDHEALQLILSSATEAVHRLQFYRQAYGRLNDHGEASLAQKKQLVEDFFSTTKIKVDWPNNPAEADLSISQKMGRLILNLLIISAGTLIRGGTISIHLSADEAGAKTIEMEGKGDTIKIDDDVLRVLRKEAQLSQLSPKTAQLALTLELADEIGATLKIDVDAGRFKVTAVQQTVVHAEQPHSFA